MLEAWGKKSGLHKDVGRAGTVLTPSLSLLESGPDGLDGADEEQDRDPHGGRCGR